MNTYHKIITIFERDPETKFRTLIDGKFALPEFEYLQHDEWDWTEKVDGTNIRIMFSRTFSGTLAFGGKSDKAQIPAHLMNRLNTLFLPLQDKFVEMFEDGVCLYGEGYGAKIQKGGGNYRPDQDFVLFDVKINGWWLQRKDVEDIAGKLGLDIVPIIDRGNLHEMVKYAKEGFDSQWGAFRAEGIVARPSAELQTRAGQRIITKIKYKDWQRG